MKTLVKSLVLGAFLLLLVPAAMACWPDDQAGFYVPGQMQVGNVLLEPGIYSVRAVHAFPGHNVLTITSSDGTKVYATVLATPHTLAPHEVQGRSRLLYVHSEEGAPSALRSFLVANSSFGYDIYARPMAARQAKVVTRELVAIAESR
ncbi:MAG: hypothetical protein U0529_23305 [Thermoanaerobaculia bacterium]